MRAALLKLASVFIAAQLTSGMKYERFAEKLKKHGFVPAERIPVARDFNFNLKLRFKPITYAVNLTIFFRQDSALILFVYTDTANADRIVLSGYGEEAERAIFDAWLRDWADAKLAESSIQLNAHETEKLDAAATITVRHVFREISKIRRECAERNVDIGRRQQLQQTAKRISDIESTLIGKYLKHLHANK